MADMLDEIIAKNAEIDRLSAELAEARRALLAGNDTVLANKKLQEDNAAKDARIAELEATRLHWTGEVARLTQDSCDDQDRADRAEAERDVLDHAFKVLGKDMANLGRERDAMREALEKIARGIPGLTSFTGIARAALAPSPAMREG